MTHSDLGKHGGLVNVSPPTCAASDPASAAEMPTQVDEMVRNILAAAEQLPGAHTVVLSDALGKLLEEAGVNVAWSAEEPEFDVAARWRAAPVLVFVAAVVAFVAAMAGLVWVLTHTHRGDDRVLPSPVMGAPWTMPASALPPITPTAPLAPEPKVADPVPSTVTVTQTPAAAPAPLRDADQIFLYEMRSNGIAITDEATAERDARQGCDYLAAGHTPREAAALAMRNNPTLTLQEAELYVDATIRAYCPGAS